MNLKSNIECRSAERDALNLPHQSTPIEQELQLRNARCNPCGVPQPHEATKPHHCALQRISRLNCSNSNPKASTIHELLPYRGFGRAVRQCDFDHHHLSKHIDEVHACHPCPLVSKSPMPPSDWLANSGRILDVKLAIGMHTPRNSESEPTGRVPRARSIN